MSFMVVSAADVYSTNRDHVRSRELYEPPYELMGWLRQYDGSTFYVGTPNGWHGAIVSNGMRFLDAWYGMEPLLPTAGATNTRPVRALPTYMALGNDKVPDRPAELVRQFSQHSVWRLPGSLPFAFVVADALLYDPAGGAELGATDVRALQPATASPNRISVQADGAGGETLVVLASAYRGWRLTVDGKPGLLRNVGGYLAASLEPGLHHYEFSFAPVSFGSGAGSEPRLDYGTLGACHKERHVETATIQDHCGLFRGCVASGDSVGRPGGHIGAGHRRAL